MHWYKHRSLFFCFKSKNASYLEGSGAKLEAIIRNFTVATTHPVCLHLVVLGSRNLLHKYLFDGSMCLPMPPMNI